MLFLKIFLRRRDTAYSILAIALLIAILTSANTIINYLNTQVEVLAGLREPAGRYIIMSGNSISESRIDNKLLDQIYSLQYIDNLIPEKYIWPNMTLNSKPIEAPIRGVSNVENFLKARKASLRGSAAKNMNEAVVGELIANAYPINISSEIYLAYGVRDTVLVVVGIFKT